MVDIKNDMPEDFAWLFPFPGDWLYNAQPVFKKIFFDGGLEQLAAKMGYPAGAVKTALKESKNFRKNHLFLIECWEAMYRRMVQQFLKHKGYASDAGASSGGESEAGLREVERDLAAFSVPPARNLDAVGPQVGWSNHHGPAQTGP
jgi:hypothetical protein